MKKEIGIIELLNLLKIRWKTFLLTIITFTVAGVLINFIIPPTYESKIDILVNHTKNLGNSSLEAGDIEMSLRFTETYKYMLKSDRILSEVIENLEEPYKKTDLINNISTESISNSPIITIIGREKTPELAAELVNTYATVFQDEIKTLMDLDNISVLNATPSGADIEEIKPPLIIVGLISFFIGFSLSVLVVLIQEYYYAKLDTELKTEYALKIPNLGIIPKIKNGLLNNGKVNSLGEQPIGDLKSSKTYSEEFRRMRANVQFHMSKKNAKTLLVTSAVLGDGKSLISGNLAIVMAMGGKRIVFVDADLRRPIGRELFNILDRRGLTSFVSGHYELNEIIQKTEIKNLSFIGAGPIPPNPAEVLSSDEMGKVIKLLKDQYDFVVIDTPPLVVSDAISLSTIVDGCLYVIDAERTKEELASKSLEQLKMVGAPILGTVLNRGVSTKIVTYEY